MSHHIVAPLNVFEDMQMQNSVHQITSCLFYGVLFPSGVKSHTQRRIITHLRRESLGMLAQPDSWSHMMCVCVVWCGELCGLVVKVADWQPKGARF